MPEKQRKITIGFNFEDEFGNKFSSSTTSEVFPDLGESELDFIGEQFNIFLRQCGYYRKNNLIFMEDLTEEEWCAINDYLVDFRESNKEKGELER